MSVNVLVRLPPYISLVAYYFFNMSTGDRVLPGETFCHELLIHISEIVVFEQKIVLLSTCKNHMSVKILIMKFASRPHFRSVKYGSRIGMVVILLKGD